MIGSNPGSGGGQRPRPMTPIGGNFGEAFDENALSALGSATQQAGQGSGSSSQTSALSSLAGAAGAGKLSAAQQAALAQQAGGGGLPGADSARAKDPRPVGSLVQELIQRPISDIAEGLQSLFSLSGLLGIENPADDPQKKAKRRQIHQRYQQLTQAEQAEAQRQYQAEMERKQKEQQEAEEKRRREAAKQSETIQAPSGSKKGPDAGGGSRKQRAVTQLQNSRKQLSNPAGAD